MLYTTQLNDKFSISNMKVPSFIKHCTDCKLGTIVDSYIHVLQQSVKANNGFKYKAFPRMTIQIEYEGESYFILKEALNDFHTTDYVRYISDSVSDDQVVKLKSQLPKPGTQVSLYFNLKSRDGYADFNNYKYRLLKTVDMPSEASGCIYIGFDKIERIKP